MFKTPNKTSNYSIEYKAINLKNTVAFEHTDSLWRKLFDAYILFSTYIVLFDNLYSVYFAIIKYNELYNIK